MQDKININTIKKLLDAKNVYRSITKWFKVQMSQSGLQSGLKFRCPTFWM